MIIDWGPDYHGRPGDRWHRSLLTSELVLLEGDVVTECAIFIDFVTNALFLPLLTLPL